MHAAIDKNHRLEDLLDQLIGDESLRLEFFATPVDACATAGIPLSWSEIGALLALPTAYFDEFAKGLPAQADPPAAWLQQRPTTWAPLKH